LTGLLAVSASAQTSPNNIAKSPAPQPVTPLADSKLEYRLLATNKTSTMQKELNQASADGYRFGGVMGGETAFGGSEVVVIIRRDPATDSRRPEYRLLATSKTSTMQKELQQAGDAGFEYKGQTVFPTMFGGKEVVVILERDPDANTLWDYRLLATNKTSTMDKELNQAGADGYEFTGVTVSQTAFGGHEVVCILRRPRKN
jgi:hypothetical protein